MSERVNENLLSFGFEEQSLRNCLSMLMMFIVGLFLTILFFKKGKRSGGTQ